MLITSVLHYMNPNEKERFIFHLSQVLRKAKMVSLMPHPNNNHNFTYLMWILMNLQSWDHVIYTHANEMAGSVDSTAGQLFDWR